MNIANYEPLQASSYIPTPKIFEGKFAILNIQNNDEKCFLWSVLAHLHHMPSKNYPNRVLMYKDYEKELNVRDISWPMKEDKIRGFEKY